MKLVFAAGFILVSALACAQEPAGNDGLAALRVTGVAANDVLNLRAEPDAASAIAGMLAPDETNIAVVGQAVGSLDWLMVEKGAARGWANARYLAYDGGDAPVALPVRLFCAGTEPFWGLDLGYCVADAGLAFEDRRARLALKAPSPARGRFQPWLLASATPEDPGTFMLVEEAACSDGMSDQIHRFSVAAQIGGAFLSGCCR